MESEPLVSICIPVYNGALYVSQAIESALNQSYENLEVVVVDNASSDCTPQILERLRLANPDRIRIYCNRETVAMVENFNIALGWADGEYLKLLPHDDLLSVDSVRDLMAARQAGDEFIVGLREFIFERTGVRNRFFYARQNLFWRVDRALGVGYVSPQSYLNAFSGNTCHNLVGEPGSVLISAKAFREVGGFDQRSHQLCDLHLWHRLGTKFGLRVVSKPVALFRVHDASESAKRELGRTRLLGECLEISTFMLSCLGSKEDRGIVCNYLLDWARYAREYRFSSNQPTPLIESRGVFSRLLGLIVAIPIKRVYQLLMLKTFYILFSVFGEEPSRSASPNHQ